MWKGQVPDSYIIDWKALLLLYKALTRLSLLLWSICPNIKQPDFIHMFCIGSNRNKHIYEHCKLEDTKKTGKINVF